MLVRLEVKGGNIPQTDSPVHIQHRSQQADQAQADVVDKADRRSDGCRQGVRVII